MLCAQEHGATVLPPDPGSLSQQHQGGQQQEGHEGATFTGHGLVLRLHSAPAAPAPATTTEAEPSDGHQQEVEASNHGTHHVACLIPNHLGKAGRREGAALPLPYSSGSRKWRECLCTPGNPHGTPEAMASLLITIAQMRRLRSRDTGDHCPPHLEGKGCLRPHSGKHSARWAELSGHGPFCSPLTLSPAPGTPSSPHLSSQKMGRSAGSLSTLGKGSKLRVWGQPPPCP